MRYAVKTDNLITNLIVADPAQREELEAALGAELLSLDEYSLTIGDLWNGEAWTRNRDGEQVVIDPAPAAEIPAEERIAALERITGALLTGEE